MPPNSRNKLGPPPPTMTWVKALPVLVIALIFDALRALANLLWLWGPIVAGKATEWYIGGTTGKVVGYVVTVSGVGASYTPGVGQLIVGMGAVLAMAIGFCGWLAIGGLLLISNSRILKTSVLPYVCSLGVSEVPFLNILPALFSTMVTLYTIQIRKEKAALKKYREQAKALQIEERQQCARAFVQQMSNEEEDADDEIPQALPAAA